MNKVCILAVLPFVACTDSPTLIAHVDAQVERVATTPNGGVYWIDTPYSSGHPRVMHAQDGAVDVVSDDQVWSFHLATNQSSVFWTRSDDALAAAPANGGATTLLAAPGTLDNISVNAIAATSDTVYIAREAPGEIVAFPTQPGAAPTTIVSNLTAPDALAVDATNLYWLDKTDRAVYQRARQADPATPPSRLATLDLDGPLRPRGAIATDGVHLYWSDTHAHAMRISDGARFELASADCSTDFFTVQALALDASHVYWLSTCDGPRIERAPLAGGETELVAAIASESTSANIALTADSVVYAARRATCDDTIMDCPPDTIESVSK